MRLVKVHYNEPVIAWLLMQCGINSTRKFHSSTQLCLTIPYTKELNYYN